MNTDAGAGGRITRLIEAALLEDIGMGDVTSEGIVGEKIPGVARFLCKGEGIIAGLEVAAEVLALCDPGSRLEVLTRDGARVHPGEILAVSRGSIKGLLIGERTALNFLQRMSGIATSTRAYVEAVRGTRAKITDTRKTAPGLRILDKMAVRLGGGVNHRFGLDDLALIKDNHIVAAGSITRAVSLVAQHLRERGLNLAIEVETKSPEEVEEALQCEDVTRIMLDNFPLAAMEQAVRRIAGKVEVEASGGITLATVKDVARTGVDFISVGALTHSVQGLDISLELSPDV
jgi:nicotinate-nucleotide pyrophosphorylase (carboxylating)